MTGWNLPPGCNVSDIPGNRPEDVAWDNWWEREAKFLHEEYNKEHETYHGNPGDEYDNNSAFREWVNDRFNEYYYEKRRYP